MIKVLLNGCLGKMGKVITECAKNYEDIKITGGIDKSIPDFDPGYTVFTDINKCTDDYDVLLDFSRPESLDDLINYCKGKKIPLILCTTGYTKTQLCNIQQMSKIIPIFRSANMSIGINIINNILKEFTKKLYSDFDIEIIDKHHNQKVDSPSGTALLLGDTIKDCIPEQTEYVYGREGSSKRAKSEIGMHSLRGGTIVGEHEVIFAGKGETIEIKHTAISREVFAVGAIKACDFMANKAPGLYSMDDIINCK